MSSAGVKTASYAYDPYGRTRTATGPNAASNAFRYAGGLFDTTTGATKFGARYYDPNTGRFTQPDPSGQETNNYAYAGGNPISYNDPTGLDGVEDILFGLGAIGAALVALGTAEITLPVAAGAFLLDATGGALVGCGASLLEPEEISGTPESCYEAGDC